MNYYVNLTKQTLKFVARMWYMFMFLGLAIISIVMPRDAYVSPPKPVVASNSECMEKYRWDTTAVNTSRFVVAMNLNKQGKGELAKYVSDREAVELVYCSK